jgi:hypothetical protein
MDYTKCPSSSGQRIVTPPSARRLRRPLVGIVIAAVLLQFGARCSSAQSEAGPLEDPARQFGSWSKFADWCPNSEVETCDLVCPGWYGSGEYLAWRLRPQGLDYAIAAEEVETAVGVGAVKNVEFSRDAGYRLGLGYVTQTGWDLGFRYTSFDTDQTASAAAPALGTPLEGTLWATRSHPSVNEEADTAIANATLDYQTFDFEIGRWFELNRFTAIRVIGGLRWLSGDQQLRIQYDGQQFDDGVVRDQITNQAFGIRVGAEGHWKMWGGWSAFARGIGSVAYTRSDLRLLETNKTGQAGQTLIVDISDRFTAPATNLEAAVGLSWKRGSWGISGGYEMTHWLNLSNRTTFDGVHAGAYNPLPMDLLLEGMFFQVAYSH